MLKGIFNRREDEQKIKQEGRLPPGQSLTNRFPVLHYGPVPRLTRQRGICASLVKLKRKSVGAGMNLTGFHAPKSKWISTALPAGASSIQNGKVYP